MVTIYKAHGGHAAAIVKLLAQLAAYEGMESVFSPEQTQLQSDLEGRFRGSTLHAFLAEEEGVTVGVALGYFGCYSSFKSTWKFYLEDIFVLANFRGTGVGKQLLRHVARYAATHARVHEVTFSVLEWNESAIAAYKKLGAVVVGTSTAEDGTKWIAMSFRNEAFEALAET